MHTPGGVSFFMSRKITEAESIGANALKWEAMGRCDVAEALEMQRIETRALCRLLRDKTPKEESESPDWWK